MLRRQAPGQAAPASDLTWTLFGLLPSPESYPGWRPASRPTNQGFKVQGSALCFLRHELGKSSNLNLEPERCLVIFVRANHSKTSAERAGPTVCIPSWPPIPTASHFVWFADTVTASTTIAGDPEWRRDPKRSVSGPERPYRASRGRRRGPPVSRFRSSATVKEWELQ